MQPIYRVGLKNLPIKHLSNFYDHFQQPVRSFLIHLGGETEQLGAKS